MTKTEIKRWIAYWSAAKMVAFDQITTFDRMFQARKYCLCMRTGVFSEVSDGDLWDALKEYRDNKIVDPIGEA